MPPTWYSKAQTDALLSGKASTGHTHPSAVFNVKDYGALGNGTANDRAAIQSALDAASAAGGGTVFLPAGTYKVGRVSSGTASSTWHALAVPTGVRLIGAGQKATTISYDNSINPTPLPGSTTALNPRLVIISVGTWVSMASRVEVAHLRVLGNNLANPYRFGDGGAYLHIGIASRADKVGVPALSPSDCNNVWVHHVTVEDCGLGVGCNPNATIADGSGVVPTDTPHHWRVEDCHFKTITNKSVELQGDDMWILRNTTENVFDGLQIIGADSRRCVIRDNIVSYGETGISITEGASDVLVEGNYLTADAPAAFSGAPGGQNSLGSTSLGGITIRREPVAGSLTYRNLRIVNNHVDASLATSTRALSIHKHNSSGAVVIDSLIIHGNTLLGDTYLYDWGSGAAAAGSFCTGVRFTENRVVGLLLTTELLASNYALHAGNFVTQAVQFIIKTKFSIWRDNIIQITNNSGTVIPAGCTTNLITGNYFQTSLTDSGTNNTKSLNNVAGASTWV